LLQRNLEYFPSFEASGKSVSRVIARLDSRWKRPRHWPGRGLNAWRPAKRLKNSL
jgi:hypothetical protein